MHEHTFVHPVSLRDLALALVADGVNDCEIARRLELPRATVRDWRRPRYVPRGDRERDVCPRCWRSTRRIVFSDADYAELLGLYLGDGHITALQRTERLRLSLDAKYPNINDETEALLRRCFPQNRVGRVLLGGGSTVVLHVYSSHLSCLFPQHGPGKKHERAILLEPWQVELVAAAPWSFVRGCIRSDGCAFVNGRGSTSTCRTTSTTSPRRSVSSSLMSVAASAWPAARPETGSASTVATASRSCSSTSASRPDPPSAR
jgi:hypothetical protein